VGLYLQLLFWLKVIFGAVWFIELLIIFGCILVCLMIFYNNNNNNTNEICLVPLGRDFRLTVTKWICFRLLCNELSEPIKIIFFFN